MINSRNQVTLGDTYLTMLWSDTESTGVLLLLKVQGVDKLFKSVISSDSKNRCTMATVSWVGVGMSIGL